MNSHEFHELTHYVMDSPASPPASLFAGGFDDWRSRARLAHFLAMPELKKHDEAIELFRSVVEVEIDEENPEQVEEKVYALQRLSSCLREDKKYDDAKHQIEQFYDLLDNKINIMTNNYIFDTLLNDYIFLIKSKYNAKVKSLINIGNDSFFKDVNNCTEIITIISNFFEQSDKTYLEIKLIEYGTYIELDLFVESNFDKINDDNNIDYFDDYAHLRRIFDK